MITLDEPQVPPRRKRRRVRIAVAVIALVALVLGGLAVFFAWGMGAGGGGSEVAVVIPQGATATEIASILEEKKVVRSAFVFRIVARLRGVSSEFKPGAYKMQTGLGVNGAIDALRKGIPEAVARFTIPEGLTVREIARVIGRDTQVTETQFLAALRSAKDVPDIMRAHFRGRTSYRPEDFEGFLFPNTYEIAVRATPAELVAKLLSQFEQETSSLDIAAGARARGLSAYDVITLASLVEKEARCREDLIEEKAPCADDHQLISSVIYNRLDVGMRLQIDATIQYVYIQRNGRPKNPLHESDYGLRSTYNTYQIDGLPPTPIAVPGIRSIRAALQPSSSDWLFYRLCNANRLIYGHIFGRTLDERDRKWRADPRCA